MIAVMRRILCLLCLLRYRFKIGFLFALLTLEVFGLLHVRQHVVTHKLGPHEKICAEGIYNGVTLVVNEHLKIIHRL